jgi:tripartite ATP-independent transporter DctM subunit
MTPESVGLIGIIAVVFLLMTGMWIGVVMALVGFLGYAYLAGLQPAFGVIAKIPFSTIADFPMSCVPLFILMGQIIFETGMGTDLFYSANKWIGQVRGGLCMAVTIACALFGAVTGLPAPSAITMSKVAFPEMKKYGYDESLSIGSIAAAALLAAMIPPSVPFIIYGILTENSVGKLYMAGILPGILLAVLFIGVIWVITFYKPELAPAKAKTTFIEKIVSMKYIWPVLVLFLLMLGGIYGGFFTPTEAGAISAAGATLIGIVLKRLTLKKFLNAVLDTTLMTGMAFLLIMGAFILMKFLAISKLPAMISIMVADLHVSRTVIFIGLVILYLILGCFLDIMSAVILTLPIVYPLITSLNYDPIWFGVIVVLLVQAGLITPPVGLDVFTVSGASGIPVGIIFKGASYFLIGLIICLVILYIFPEIALFLPNRM